MTIELTDTSFEDLQRKAQQRGEHIYQPIDLGIQYNLPTHLGEGFERLLKLRHGLTIYIGKG
ncbi:MAG: AraC family transcriptional regulator, partial [Merismopedia sp. SIO2A8]|nr:AraC family transcriptional regulator [Merismopedia sp. SIO2A8]